MPDHPDGDGDFASLYRRTLAPLRRYLTRLLGNAGEAQDVAHDAYLRVYPTIEGHAATKPQALLYLTARRLAINRLKHRGVSSQVHETLQVDTGQAVPDSVEQQVMLRQELGFLQAAIAQLPEGCRAVLLLRNLELLSHREIAQRLGIAISTVEKQHARALRLLRAALPRDSSPSSSASPTEPSAGS